MPERITAWCIAGTVLGAIVALSFVLGTLVGEELGYTRMAWHCDDFSHFLAGPGQAFECQRVDAGAGPSGS